MARLTSKQIRENIQEKIRQQYPGLVAKYQEDFCTSFSENKNIGTPAAPECIWELIPVTSSGNICFYYLPHK